MGISTKRALAFIIDMAIISMAFGLIKNFIPLEIEVKEYDYGAFTVLIRFSFIFVFYLLYLFLFDVLAKGTTIGKMLLKIGVVDQKSSKTPELSALLLRSVYKTVSIILLPFAVLLFYLFDNFTLQDKMCNTKTVQVI